MPSVFMAQSNLIDNAPLPVLGSLQAFAKSIHRREP